MRKILTLIAILMAAGAAAVPEPQPKSKRPTMWVVRIEGVKRDFLIPIGVAKDFGLKPGATITDKIARKIAEEMGADYPADIKAKLEAMQ